MIRGSSPLTPTIGIDIGIDISALTIYAISLFYLKGFDLLNDLACEFNLNNLAMFLVKINDLINVRVVSCCETANYFFIMPEIEVKKILQDIPENILEPTIKLLNKLKITLEMYIHIS